MGGQQLSTRRRCAVLGSPIAHSLSPALHGAAYHALDLAWSYEAIEVDEATLAGFVAGLDDSWRGLSLTMPLKRAVLALADECSDTVRAVGVANTLILGADGTKAAHNTDVPGFVEVLGALGAGPGPTAVLGGGATAAAAVAALARLSVPVEVYVRTAGRGPALAEVAQRTGAALALRPWSEVAEALTRSVVVSTLPGDTAAGLLPVGEQTGESGLAAGGRTRLGALLDVSYHPWPTSAARWWASAGGQVEGGLELLVQQAVLQVRLMTGHQVDASLLREAGQRALAQRGAPTPDAPAWEATT